MPTSESTPEAPVSVLDLSKLKKGDRVQHALMVQSRDERTTKDGKPFVSLSVGNRSGSLDVVPIWQERLEWVEGVQPGKLVQVLGSITLYKEKRQLDRIRTWLVARGYRQLSGGEGTRFPRGGEAVSCHADVELGPEGHPAPEREHADLEARAPEGAVWHFRSRHGQQRSGRPAAPSRPRALIAPMG